MRASPPFDPLAPLPPGLTLLEASAGTGKTFNMTTVWLRLVLEYGVDPRAIAVVTYTRAATTEIRQRLRARLLGLQDYLHATAINPESTGSPDGAEPLFGHLRAVARDDAALLARVLAGLDGLDDAPIATIHGFCQRTLVQHTAETGLSTTRHELDEARFIRTISDDFWTLVSTETTPQLFANLLKAGINAARCFEIATEVAKNPGASVTTVLGNEELVIAPAGPAAATPGAVDVRRAETVSDVVRLLVLHARAESRRRAIDAAILTFNDMLLRLDETLRDPIAGPPVIASLRRQLSAVLIDEFQDTDALQWRIFSTVFHTPSHRLVVIGDPKQSIYGFRNADIQTYFDAARQVEHHYSLTTNYRSDAALTRALNGFFGSPAGTLAFADQGIHFAPSQSARDDAGVEPPQAPLRIAVVCDSGPPRLLKRPDAEALVPPRLAADIAAFLGQAGGVWVTDPRSGERRRASADDITVIVRTHNQARLCREALTAAGIPCASNDRGNVFRTAEALDLWRVLRAVMLPRHLPWVRGALATGLFNVSLHAIVVREAAGDRLVAETAESFRALQHLWLERGFFAAFRQLLTLCRPHLLATDGGDTRVSRLEVLGELLADKATRERLSPPYLIAWLEACILDPDTAAQGRNVEAADRPHGVTIATVHRAKGLEYPFVWVPFAFIAQGPGRAGSARVVRDPAGGAAPRLQLSAALVGLGNTEQAFPSEGFARIDESARAFEEDLRVLYVACTRARHQCTLFFSQRYMAWPESALGGLLFGEPPANGPWSREQQRRALQPLRSDAPEALVDRLRARFPGPLVAVVIPPETAPPLPAATPMPAPGPEPSSDLPAWTRDAPLDDLWRRASFSAIVRDFGADLRGHTQVATRAVDETEGTDDDASATDPSDVASEGPETAESRLLPLPGSALLGNAIHRVLEHLDFTAVDHDALVAASAEALRQHGLDPSDAPLVADKLEAVVRTPLPGGFALSDVPTTARLNELDFVIPLVGADGGPANEMVTGPALTATLRAHANPDLEAWLDSLDNQPLKPLRGFLSGSIDLVFQHPFNRKFYIADWKSNRLGADVGHYTGPHLAAAMDHHHYHLQYHLYAVAFMRFMRHRNPAFDLERDFGGVYYFFVRGMDPAHPPGSGVYFTRPPSAAIVALDALLAHGGKEPR